MIFYMKARTPKVSILVPIYNVEQYLPQCLDSLVAQTLKDIEIICLNDGSTDNSLQIIKEYASNDPRFVIINKKNSGYGDSMNKGLAKATGKYIGIVESDDWAEPTMFEKLYNLAEKHNAEAVKSNFYYYHGETGSSKKSDIIKPSEAGKVIAPINHPHILLQQATIWAGMYRRDFLKKNKIKFLATPGASFQDTSFNFKVWTTVKKAVFSTDAYLHYRIDNENSSVKSKEKAYFVCEEIHEMYRYAKAIGALDKLQAVLTHRKFDIYYWNLGRLQGKLAKEFLQYMSAEFRKMEQTGKLDDALLSQRDKLILNQIMNRPGTFMFVRKIRAPYRWVKHFLKKD